MNGFDIFKSDAFSSTSLSAAIEKLDYVPSLLGSLPNLFEPMPVRTTSVWMEERSYGAVVLPTSPRGAAPHQTAGDIRKARGFNTVRVADATRITASELQNIREFGTENSIKDLASEMARRQLKMKRNLDLTFENMRLGVVQGILKDQDGSTIYNWGTEFGVSIPASVSWALGTASGGAVRASVTAAKRAMLRALKGMVPTQIIGLCSDAFWDALISNAEVRATYLMTQDAARLRDDVTWTYGGIDWLDFGGVRFINYRGTDDNSSVAVPSGSCALFPVGAGIFQWVMAPGESFADVNTLGQQFYSMLIVDDERQRYVDLEAYAYPLPVCTMPGALYTATVS